MPEHFEYSLQSSFENDQEYFAFRCMCKLVSTKYMNRDVIRSGISPLLGRPDDTSFEHLRYWG